MELATLDIIIKRSLLERSLPIHWYSEFLFHSSAAVRILNKDTLQLINAVNLKLNSYNAADLPMDFMDDLAVCIPVDNMLSPVPKNDSINPIRIHDTTMGQFVPYTNIEDSSERTFFGFPGSWDWFWNVSDWGEPTGRYFGSNGGEHQNGYKVIKSRRQIQFTETFSSDNATLLYISNGQHIDNATQVDWMAHEAIQDYCEWKRSPNHAIKDSYEAATWYNSRRILRANLNPLTAVDIKNIFRSNYTATIKS